MQTSLHNPDDALGDLGLRLHHVGYAVQNIDEYVNRFVTPVFGPRPITPVVEDPLQKVRVVFVDVPGGLLELVEPTAADSPAQGIIKLGRGGLYHACYATSRFDEALERMSQSGCRALSRPVPATAFCQKRAVFLLTPFYSVIELVEEGESTGQ